MEDDGRLTCTTPAARCGSGACVEAVEVSINSEAYSSDGVEFTYHNATVSAVSVVSGPAFGEHGADRARRGLRQSDGGARSAARTRRSSRRSSTRRRCSATRRPPPTPASAARATLTWRRPFRPRVAPLVARPPAPHRRGAPARQAPRWSRRRAVALDPGASLADAPSFRLAFDVLVEHPGSITGAHLGESVTACVGVISRQHPSFNEHGLEEGLCVALLESTCRTSR